MQETSSHIKCNCAVNKDNKLLLLTIPFDECWTATVDGKKNRYFKSL